MATVDAVVLCCQQVPASHATEIDAAYVEIRPLSDIAGWFEKLQEKLFLSEALS